MRDLVRDALSDCGLLLGSVPPGGAPGQEAAGGRGTTTSQLATVGDAEEITVREGFSFSGSEQIKPGAAAYAALVLVRPLLSLARKANANHLYPTLIDELLADADRFLEAAWECELQGKIVECADAPESLGAHEFGSKIATLIDLAETPDEREMLSRVLQQWANRMAPGASR